MRATAILRGAALVTLLLATGHLLGNPWTPVTDDAGARVVNAMNGYHFDVTGVARSYFDFYVGFGWLIGAYLLGHAALFWQLATLAPRAGADVRPIVAVLCAESLCVSLLSLRFLFWIPVALSSVVSICLLLALFALRPRSLTPTA